MKEKESARKKTVVVDVSLIRELVVILCCILSTVALLAYLALTGARAVAAEVETTGETSLAASTGMRQFYLTEDGYHGGIAKTACAEGYHMASLWEIADPSNLEYNTTLGYALTDSGEGPPADEVGGWVRTGYVGDVSETIGRANCDGWTVWGADRHGTTAALPTHWTTGLQDLGVWVLELHECPSGRRVWCIED